MPKESQRSHLSPSILYVVVEEAKVQWKNIFTAKISFQKRSWLLGGIPTLKGPKSSRWIPLNLYVVVAKAKVLQRDEQPNSKQMESLIFGSWSLEWEPSSDCPLRSHRRLSILSVQWQGLGHYRRSPYPLTWLSHLTNSLLPSAMTQNPLPVKDRTTAMTSDVC